MHTSENQFKLGENFYLPVSYGRKVIKSYVSKEKSYTKKELQKQLSDQFNLFTQTLQEQGIQLKNKDVKIHIGTNTAAAKGTLYLNERITQKADTEKISIEQSENTRNETIAE